MKYSSWECVQPYRSHSPSSPNQLEWHFKRALSYTGPFVTASYQSSQEITRQDGKIQLREQRELPQRVWNLHSKKEVIFLKRELPPKTSTYCRQDRVGRFYLSCTRAELQCRCLTETMLTFFLTRRCGLASSKENNQNIGCRKWWEFAATWMM